MRRRAVLLDRDGVLCEPATAGGRPRPNGAVVVTSDTVLACRVMKRAGLLLVVVTNQPDVARGICDRETVDAVNDELVRRLCLDGALVCPHDDADRCACRKPLPGLLLEAAARWPIGLPGSVMVGDRWRDIEAGRAAGCATVLVERGHDEPLATGADLVVGSLREAVPWILRRLAPEEDRS